MLHVDKLSNYKNHMKFNWKSKSALYIGRFQPFHEGHKQMFLEGLKKYGVTHHHRKGFKPIHNMLFD